MNSPLRLTVGVAVAMLAVSPSASQAQTERISVQFDNAPLRDVVVQFARFSGRTIILDGEAGNPAVNASITNMAWLTSLDQIAESHDLDMRADTSGIILIKRRGRISVTLLNASLKDVIANFGSFGGRTIVLPQDLADVTVNATVQDTDWRRALDSVLAPHSLVAVRGANGIIRVDRRTPSPVTPPPDGV
jgi:ferric-dicitrate binding protein FerR (iron transport regulator)